MGQNFKWKLYKYFDKQQAMNTVYFIVARNFNSLKNLLYTGLFWQWNIFANFVFLCFVVKINFTKVSPCHTFLLSMRGILQNFFFCKRNFGAFLQRIFHRQNKLVYGIKLLISLYMRMFLVLLNNYVMPHTLFVKYFKIIIPLKSFLLKL